MNAPACAAPAALPRTPPPTSVATRPTPARRPAVVARDTNELRDGLVRLLPELRARALRLCGDPATANDVAQDAIERALRFSDQYERSTNLRAWTFQILFSVFVTRWRRRRRERRALDCLASDPCAWTVPAGFAAPDAGKGAILPAAQRKLDALPEGFRAVVVLVDIEQWSYRDAARALGVPIGTVMSRLHRARKLLAAELASEREAA